MFKKSLGRLRRGEKDCSCTEIGWRTRATCGILNLANEAEGWVFVIYKKGVYHHSTGLRSLREG